MKKGHTKAPRDVVDISWARFLIYATLCRLLSVVVLWCVVGSVIWASPLS